MLTSEQSQRTECKQKRDCFSYIQRVQLNANALIRFGIEKRRVTIMLTHRMFQRKRENRRAPTKSLR